MLIIPSILNKSDFLDVPLNYLWDNESSTFYFVDAHNEKIGRALWTLNHKATLGLATALSEWILWRISKYIDRPVVNQALEAQWAGVIDKHYIVGWKYSQKYMSEPDTGPLWTLLSCVQYPRLNYIRGNYFINKKVPNLAMLARHVSPEPQFFDDWFSHVLERLAKLFPAQYDYEEIINDIDEREDEVYDSSQEPVIPREFFWQNDFDYVSADNSKLINNFLSSLENNNSQFLIKARDMKKRGFDGIPYKYEE